MKLTKIITILLLAFITISCNETKKEKSEEVQEVALKTEAKTEPIKEEKSLYDRLGGEAGISVIVDDIVAAHLANPTIKDSFSHLEENPEHMNLFKQNVKDFFGAGTGGNVTYSGRDMPTAHKGLNISGIEFVEGISDIMMVLNDHNIDVESQKDVLFILFSFKEQIIAQ